jgi:MFS transporter, OFA family, oxalate/formate antiporter
MADDAMTGPKQDGFESRFFYGWVIVGACFTCCASYGTFYTFGIFFKPVQEEFHWSYTVTSSLQSLQVLVYILSSLLVGWATDRLGPRLPLLLGALCLGGGYVLCSKVQSLLDFYLFYSLASIGSGIAWALPLSTVQRWFIYRRGLALGLALSGIGIGTFIWAPVVTYFIYTAGWRTAYVVMGLASWLLLTLAALVIATPEKKGCRPYRAKSNPSDGMERTSSGSLEQGFDTSQAFRTPQLWLICLIQFLFNMGVFLIFVHLVPYCIQMGIDKLEAGKAIGLVGGISVLGRIITPTFVEKRLGAKWGLGLLVCGMAAGVMQVYLNLVSSLYMVYVFVFVYGFFYGSWIPTVVALTGSYFGVRNLGAILGLTQIGLVGGIIGPMLGGVVYDKLGNYPVAFYICFFAFACAGIIAFLMKTPYPKAA